MSLILAGKGFATAYGSVSVGDVAEEMRTARESITALRHDPERADHADALSDPEVMFVLGQADIAMMIETSDFRSVLDLRYPRAQSFAASVNWVFSVPYEIEELQSPDEPEPDSLRFLLNLRLRRVVYAYPGAEEKIVERLVYLLDREGLSARIHAGLGWSDLVIDGRFTRAKFEKLIHFIISAHGLRLQIGEQEHERIPVLQRMLTVLAYTGDPPAFADSTHVTFLRALPGGYDDVSRLLQQFGDVTILDGKADFMVTAHDDDPYWLAKQRTLGEKQNRKLLQKVETHLMFRPAGEFDNVSEGPLLAIRMGDEILHVDHCDCKQLRETFIEVLERRINAVSAVLPQEQRYAIDNILFLLSHTLRDARSICCDVRDAVTACYHGLLMILDALDEQNAHLTTAPAAGLGSASVHHDLRMHYEQMTALWRRLDEWHRFADLLLRQRTVGSYEEILGQSDRSVVYSGGVQKFLYLADCMLNHFAKRVDPDAPPFAVIYDSVKTILSFPTGLVRVPTRNIFTLPLSIVDLWHEAATMLFRLRNGQKIADFTPEGEEKKDFIANLADHYADLVVYLYGFGGNFEKFLASMAYGFEQIYGKVVYAVRAYAYRQVLTRLYLVSEFHALRIVRGRGDRAKLLQFADPAHTVPTVTASLRRMFEEKKVAERYPSFASFPPVYWDLLEISVMTEDFSLYHRNLYLQLLDIVVTREEKSLKGFEEGKLTDFPPDADLNDYFAQLAYFIQAFDRVEPRKDDPDAIPYFKMMASLGKSATIEYHRRQISLRKP